MVKVRKVALSTALFLSLGSAPQAAQTGNPPTASSLDCKVSAVGVTAADTVSSTNATAYSDVSDAAVTFKQKKNSCIVVDFTATGTGNDVLLVHVLLDGVEMFPGEIALGDGLRTMSWMGGITAGQHTVQVQFRSGVNGRTVTIATHTTSVAHK